jgi:putative ABC transport system permease protein
VTRRAAVSAVSRRTLLSGRLFTAADDAVAPPVAMVNLSMVRHFFPDTDPVGRRVSFDSGRTWMTIVGMVNDTRDYALDEKPTDEIYRAFAQNRAVECDAPGARRVGSIGVRAPLPRRRARGGRPPAGEPHPDARSCAQPIAGAAASDRAARDMFAAVAPVITAAGIAGVVSFLVNQRTTEIAVRMALGAPRSSVVRMILGQGLGPVAAGLVLGIGGALMLTRVVTRLLFAVEPTDPPTYVAVAITLAVVAALACLAPARRAAAIDPMRALRADLYKAT